MNTITINGERVEISMPPVMSHDELQRLMIRAALAGDLYTCAVCEIAMQGVPSTRTWESLPTDRKQQLHGEYLLSTGPDRWSRERAQFELLRQRQAGAA